MQYLGDFPEDSTVYIPFNTFSSDDPQASVTITNLADGDLHVHKDGSATEIVTDGATIVINFDGITGNHLAIIDTNVDAAYSTGSDYMVRMEGTTVDGGTINAWVGSFSIENRYTRGTDSAYTGTPPTPTAIVDEWETQSQADPTGFHVNIKEADSQTISAAAGVTLNAEVGASATAMDNFEDQYDTTGLIGDTFPANQAQVSNLTVAGSASKVPALLSPNGFVITFGENEANNEDTTRPLDGATHDIEAQDDTGTEKIDVYYITNVGAGAPSEVTWHGRLDKGGGAAKNIDVQVEDVDASTWRTIGNIVSSATLETHTFDIFIDEVGTGGNLGIVNIRFVTGSVAFSSTTKLITDQIFVSFNAGTISNLDAIYFDSGAGNTGTSPNDGVPGNPVSTIAAVNTLLAARNLHKVQVAPGSSVTFTTSQTDEVWEGRDWTAAANGAGTDIAGMFLFGATASGVFTATSEYVLEECDLEAATWDNDGHFERCALSGAFTVGQAGTFTFHDCFEEGTGLIPIDFAALGATTINMYHYHGDIAPTNMAAGDLLHITGAGTIATATCTDGTIDHDGFFEYTDAGGNVTENQSDIKVNVDATLVKIGTIPALDGAAQTIGAAIAKLADDNAGADFDATTDSLQAVRDHIGDGTNLTEAGGTGDHLTAINLPNQTMDITGSLSGSVGSVSGNVGGIAGTLNTLDDLDTAQDSQHSTTQSAISSLNNLAASDILTQVNAALDTAISELGVAVPTATPTLRTGLMLMYMMARNKVDVDTTGTDAMKIHNNAGTQITSKAITDDSTDYSEAKMS